MRPLIFFLFLLVPALTGAQQKPVPIHEQFSDILLSKQYLQYTEDKSKSLGLKDIAGKTFKTPESDVPNFGFSNSSYWFRLAVYNATDKLQNQLLEVKNPNIDVVKLICITTNGDTIEQQSGDYYPFEERPVHSRYYQFSVSFLPKTTTVLFLNVQNSGEQFHVPISLGSEQYYKKAGDNEQIVFGVYFGIILFALLINLFFYFVLRDRSTLWYLAYLAGLMLLQLSITGIGFEFFWPNSVYLANHANPVFANLSIFFLLRFCMEFLKTEELMPRIHRYYKILWYFMLLPSVLAWIDNHFCYMFSVMAINVIALILNMLIIPTAIYTWKKNFKPARFFTVAFVVLILSVFLFVLKNFGLVASHPLTDYGLQIGSACEVLLLTLAVIDRFKQFKDEAFHRLEEVNQLKTEANMRLERKVEERTFEIQQQKVEIEEKNHEILGSIRYAKRIQEALLPPRQVMDDLFGDYFIYYQPRDIVSGDFYWATSVSTTLKEEKNRRVALLAVADCTGHGVPGAFMSLLGTNFLKQSSGELSVNNPAQALDFLNKNVIATLNQNPGENRVRDGMDIGLIAIDYENMHLQYAGANNPIYIVRNGIMEIIQADSQAIGSVSDEVKNFTNHSYQLQKGDCIYLFTDGYADQFGGTKGKKFMYRQFRELLLRLATLPMSRQCEELDQVFKSWKGKHEQVDDVCVLGIRV